MNANPFAMVELSEIELTQVSGGDYDDNSSYRSGEIVEGTDGELWMAVEGLDGSWSMERVNDF
ncbi:MAG: hypothetical protein IPG50_23585 [Myxococcales bacterium]|nr:hypothetical protein [Myxococcales bacterium]